MKWTCAKLVSSCVSPRFALDFGLLETASVLLMTPDLAKARATTLTYFRNRQANGTAALYFDFQGMSCDKNTQRLLSQLAVHIGLKGSPAQLADSSALLDAIPELKKLRDVVFLAKLLLSGDNLPTAKKKWLAADAYLRWTYDEKAQQYVVRGFNQQLHVGKADSSFGEKVGGWFSSLLGFTKKATPSPADPSFLCGTEIQTETDVLYAPLQTIGSLNPQDTEVLVTVMTAPYVRLPLVLGFFDRTRVGALRDPQLQRMLEAVLFEPGPWRPETGGPPNPTRIPAPNRDHLATPAGLLFTELTNSPALLAQTFENFVTLAMERDTGTPLFPGFSLVSFLLRIAARGEAYIATWLASAKGTAESCGLPRKGAAEHAAAVAILEPAYARLRAAFDGPVREAVYAWIRKALKADDMVAACDAYSILALISRNSEQLSDQLSAVVFLRHHYRSVTIPMALLEVHDIYASRREELLQYLRKEPRAPAFEQVFRVATGIGDMLGLWEGEETQRVWHELAGRPSTFAPKAEQYPEGWLEVRPEEKDDYARWFARTRRPVGVQIDAGLAQFRLQDQLQALPQWVLEYPDFIGLNVPGAQGSEVESTAHRVVLRIAGHGLDLERWSPVKESYRPSAFPSSPPSASWVPKHLKIPPEQKVKVGQMLSASDSVAVFSGTRDVDGDGATIFPVEIRCLRYDPVAIEVYDVIEWARVCWAVTRSY